MTSTVDTIVMDIEEAITAAETILPTLLSVVGVFSPAAKALIPFLPLLQVALNTVQQVKQVIEPQSTPAAVQAVTNTLQAAPSTVNAVVPGPNTNG